MPRNPEETYPFENLDEGLYVHPQGVNLLCIRSRSEQEGEAEEWFIGVADYMDVQRERDNYRRALALINGWLVRQRPELSGQCAEVRTLLEKAGFDAAQGKAINGIVDSVRAGRL